MVEVTRKVWSNRHSAKNGCLKQEEKSTACCAFCLASCSAFCSAVHSAPLLLCNLHLSCFLLTCKASLCIVSKKKLVYQHYT